MKNMKKNWSSPFVLSTKTCYFVLFRMKWRTDSLLYYHPPSLTLLSPPHSYHHYHNNFHLVHDYFPQILIKFKSFPLDTFVFIVSFSTCEFLFSFIQFLISFVNLIATNYCLIMNPPTTITSASFFSYPTRQ